MAGLGEYALTCPICQAPIVLPLTQTGADLTSITLSIDLGALRRHIATAHPQETRMSAFTDRLHAFFSRFAEVSKQDLAEVEAAVEEKLHPFVNDVRAELKNDLATLEGDLKRDIADLKAKVDALLGSQPAPAPAPAEPPAAS